MALGISKVCRKIAPSVTLKMNALVAQMRAEGKDIIALGAGEPDFDTPEFIREAAKRAIDEGKTRYTAAAGMPELRKAVAKFIRNDTGVEYNFKQIIICNGAKQALVNCLTAILDPGDEVLIPAPCWVSYPEMVRMTGGKDIWLHTDEEHGFLPTPEQVEAAVTPRTKAIIINTPGNPTGAAWTRELLLKIGEIAVKHGFYIISDEIYSKLLYDGEHITVPSLSQEIYVQTILVNGFSKAYAMTGWRLGYAAGPADVIAAMDAYQSHATGNPNSIAQWAGLAALEGDQTCVREMAQAFEHRRNLIVSCIRRIPGVRCYAPQGAFYVLLDIRKLIGTMYGGRLITDSCVFAELLLEDAQVAVVPGEPFGADGYCRLSYATDEERIMEAMRRIAYFATKVCAAA